MSKIGQKSMKWTINLAVGNNDQITSLFHNSLSCLFTEKSMSQFKSSRASMIGHLTMTLSIAGSAGMSISTSSEWSLSGSSYESLSSVCFLQELTLQCFHLDPALQTIMDLLQYLQFTKMGSPFWMPFKVLSPILSITVVNDHYRKYFSKHIHFVCFSFPECFFFNQVLL